MFTPFGRLLRDIRTERQELLKHMADRLGVTSSYLSSIETGKMRPPEYWIKLVPARYNLSTERAKQLRDAVKYCRSIGIKQQKKLSTEDRELLRLFRERLPELTEEEKQNIKATIGN